MWKFVGLSLLQCMLLSSAQVMLKVSLNRLTDFAWNWAFFRGFFVYWYTWAGMGALFTAATVLWFYLLRNFPFSLAYPMTGFAYVFGMIAALLVFKEPIPVARWIGVGFMVVGAFLMTRQ